MFLTFVVIFNAPSQFLLAFMSKLLVGLKIFDLIDSTCFARKDIGSKVAHKMLVKLTIVVNFINILLAAFAPIFLHQKITKPNCG